MPHIPTAPASVRGPAPTPREHTDEVARTEFPPVTLAAPGRGELKGPLDGITIVEAAYYYATPFATALLAVAETRRLKGTAALAEKRLGVAEGRS